MRDSLMERAARLIKSDLADFFEVSTGDAEQAKRDLDDTLAHLRAGLGERLAAAHKTSKTLSALSAEHATISEKAEFAVSEGRDDLARVALARKFELSRRMDELSAELAGINAETGQLEDAIARVLAHRDAAEADNTKQGPASALSELDTLFAARRTGTDPK